MPHGSDFPHAIVSRGRSSSRSRKNLLHLLLSLRVGASAYKKIDTSTWPYLRFDPVFSLPHSNSREGFK